MDVSKVKRFLSGLSGVKEEIVPEMCSAILSVKQELENSSTSLCNFM